MTLLAYVTTATVERYTLTPTGCLVAIPAGALVASEARQSPRMEGSPMIDFDTPAEAVEGQEPPFCIDSNARAEWLMRKLANLDS